MNFTQTMTRTKSSSKASNFESAHALNNEVSRLSSNFIAVEAIDEKEISSSEEADDILVTVRDIEMS